jgi:hypothetical protein
VFKFIHFDFDFYLVGKSNHQEECYLGFRGWLGFWESYLRCQNLPKNFRQSSPTLARRPLGLECRNLLQAFIYFLKNNF